MQKAQSNPKNFNPIGTTEMIAVNTLKDIQTIEAKPKQIEILLDTFHKKNSKKSYVNKELLLFTVENQEEIQEFKQSTKDKVLTYIDNKILKSNK